MINIAAITSAAGAASYYTSTDSGQSQEAIGAYYSNADQISSTWQGAGAELADLEGKAVTKEDLQKILEGKVQQIGKDGLIEVKQLGRTVKDENGNSVIEHRAGFDLTFSSPKSVSLEAEVWGKTDVREAHDAAIKTAMGFLEEKAALTRVATGEKDENGKSTTEIVKTGNLTYSSFQHATSREGDPQTHTHVLVANVTYGEDGKARSLESKGIFQWRATADQVYKNELARGLEKLGYQVEWDQKGSFEIVGYTKEQLDVFSKRTEQVEQALKEKGMDKATASAEARQVAVFATRKNKETGHSERAEDHRPAWQAEAKENGITPAARDGYAKEHVNDYREEQRSRFQKPQGHEDQKWRGAGQRINEFSPALRQEQQWSNGLQARFQDDKTRSQGTEWTPKGRQDGTPKLNLGSPRIGLAIESPAAQPGKFDTGKTIYDRGLKGMDKASKDTLLAKAALETHSKIWFKPNNSKLDSLSKNPTVAVNFDSSGNRYFTQKDGKTFRDDLYRKQTSMQSSNWRHLGLTKTDYTVTKNGVFKSGGTLKSELFGHLGAKTRKDTASKMHKGINEARKGYFGKEHGALRAHDKALYHRGAAWAKNKAAGTVLNGGAEWQKVGGFSGLYVRARVAISTMKSKSAAMRDLKEKAAGNANKEKELAPLKTVVATNPDRPNTSSTPDNGQTKQNDITTISINGEKKLSQADIAVQKAIAHITEREFRFTEKDLWKQTARYSEGNAALSALQRGIDRAIKNGTIIDRAAQDPNQAAHKGILGRVFTTKDAMSQEKSMAQSLENGRGAHLAVMTKEQFNDAINKFEKEKGFSLSSEQRNAAGMILTKNDQFSGVQGLAGTGKTTLLEFVRQAAESSGWKIEGFSTGAAQAEKLQEESGIQSTTTARFLLDNQKENTGNSGQGPQKTLRIMDEASLAGQKQFNEVINANQ